MVKNYCLHSTVKTNLLKLCVVAPTFNPSTWEWEGGQGQPSLQSEFMDNQGYKMRPYLGKKTTTTTKVVKVRNWEGQSI